MSYTDILAAEVEDFLKTEGLIVIDQRDDATRLKGMLPHALPASDPIISELMKQRRLNPPVLVYCYHGNQSRDLCGFLAQFGLNRVHNLQGGWEAWDNWQSQQRPDTDPRYTNWLLSHGFDVDDLNSRIGLGMTPLMQAALEGDHAMVDALLATGADPRAVNDDEHHALWFACVHGDVELVKKLITCGCDIDNRNVNGVTCIIYAASTGKLEILQTLIEAGADLSIATHDGVNALESASTLPVLRALRPLMRKAG